MPELQPDLLHDHLADHAPSADCDGPHAIEQARAQIEHAVQSGQVEAICAAYFAFRLCAGAEHAQVPYHCNGLLDEQIKARVCEAYARRHCFMCNAAALRCETCNGSGQVEGDSCNACAGAGQVPCGFCDNTGWADPATIPAEWRPRVLQIQLKRTERELQQFCQAVEHHNLRELESLPPQPRRVLLARAERLAARLDELLRRGAVRKPREQKTFPHMSRMLHRVAADIRDSFAGD
jgi:hypothetical protein